MFYSYYSKIMFSYKSQVVNGWKIEIELSTLGAKSNKTFIKVIDIPKSCDIPYLQYDTIKYYWIQYDQFRGL